MSQQATMPTADLERQLGPGSVYQEYFNDWPTSVFWLLRAILVQIGHPVIRAGVEDHSTYLDDPKTRAIDTLRYALKVGMGPRKAATAKEIRELHRNIGGVDANGRRYHAWNRETWAFVALTANEAVLAAIDELGIPLPPDREAELYAGMKLINEKMQVATSKIPQSADDLRAWFDNLVRHYDYDDGLLRTITEATDNLPCPPWIPGAVWPIFQPALGLAVRHAFAVLYGTVPAELRKQTGLPWKGIHRAEYRAMVGALRIASRLPRPLRQFPPAIQRWVA